MLPYIAAGLYRCEQLKNLSAIFKQDLAPQPLKTFKCQSHGLIQLWRLKVIELDWAHLWSTMVCPGHQWTVASLHLPTWEKLGENRHSARTGAQCLSLCQMETRNVHTSYG